jgi:ribose transport system permease protein
MSPFSTAMGSARRGAREYSILAIFLVLFTTLSLASSTFLSQQNMVNLLDQAAIVGILTCGATLCMIAGIFDLSLSAVLAVSAIFAVQVTNHVGVSAGFTVGILVGAGLGLINGLVVNYVNVNSFIATLATSIVYRGLAVVITGGQIVYTPSESFRVFNDPSAIFGITMGSWLFIALAIVSGLLLTRTTFGRALYAVGGNAEAARLSGIRSKLVGTLVMGISGGLAGMAGLIAASRASSAEASMYTGLELTAIAATVIGGTSIMGGEGTIWKAVMGVFILLLIGNGFNHLGVDPTYQQVVQGVLILLAVGVDQILRRRR